MTTLADLSRILERTHLLVHSGHCMAVVGEVRQAYAQAQGAGDQLNMARALTQIAWCSFRLGDPEPGLQCAMAARRLWTRLGDLAQESTAIAIEAFILLDLGLSDDAYDAAELAVARAELAEDGLSLAFALNVKAVALVLCRQAELAQPLFEEAIALALAEGDDCARAFYLLNLGFCFAKLGDDADVAGDPAVSRHWYDLAIDATDEAIEVAAEAGAVWSLHTALTNNAEFLAGKGRVRPALSYLERAGRVQADPGPSLRIHYLYTLGVVLTQAGRLDEAEAACRFALGLAETSSQADHQINVLSCLGAVLEAKGDIAGALELHKRFHALYVRQSGESTQRRARVTELRLENERLRRDTALLAQQALTDPLTAIANRRGFERKLAALADTPFAVALLDLDHFKWVNDQHSHLVGDEVLRRVAALLSEHTGPIGNAARLGGEEFGLLFPTLDLARAAQRCEDIRLAIRDADWESLSPGLRVSASFGLAAGGRNAIATELMTVADNRLYAAKSQGRDRVVVADPLKRVAS